MYNLQKTTPWLTQMGLELTFVPNPCIPKLDACYDHDGWDVLAARYRKLCLRRQMPRADKIYCDPGCVEYPSPVLQDWGQAQDWWHKAVQLAATLKLAPHEDSQESGMGHIHMGIDQYQTMDLVSDLLRRPYLTWIFASPAANEKCKSLTCEYLDERRTYRKAIEHSAKCWDWVSGRGKALRRCYHDTTTSTTEWRAFDSAATWQEQEENFAFLHRYLSKVVRQKRPTSMQQLYDLYKHSIHHCIKGFQETLEWLELPYERYAWRIERNLVPAFEWGERR